MNEMVRGRLVLKQQTSFVLQKLIHTFCVMMGRLILFFMLKDHFYLCHNGPIIVCASIGNAAILGLPRGRGHEQGGLPQSPNLLGPQFQN